MKTATINVKTESSLKRRAQAFAKSTGMSLSDIVNLSLRQVVNDGRITIEESLTPNSATAGELRKIEKDIKRGKGLSKVFVSAKEMDAHLDNL